MILPKTARLTPAQIDELSAIVGEFNCRIQPIVGAVRTIYAILGDERDELMVNRIEGLEYVDRVDRIQSTHKLMDLRSDLASHSICIGGVTVGEELLVIAGQCTIDPKNPNYFLDTAAAMKEAGGARDPRRGVEAAYQSLQLPGGREVARYFDGGLAADRVARRCGGDG